MFRQFHNEIGGEVLARPPWYIVHDDRDVQVCEDRVVLDQPGPVRLVIVRADDKHPVGTEILCCLGEPHGFRSVVGTGACNDRHPPVDHIDRLLDDSLMFLKTERC